ncbi:MAG: DUF1735 domain-containing protein [Chitinophagaceae bacterium]|nr:DUF1735 domain-containing protein [Chitinophagaceae bacterium]
MNYTIKRIMFFGGALLLMFNLTSCLKKTESPNVSGAKPIVGLWIDQGLGAVDASGYNAGGKYNVYNRTVKCFPSPDTAYLDVKVSYLGGENAPQDIVVSLAVDNTLLTDFNAEGDFSANWGVDVTQPAAADVWSIPTSVTIPQGQKSGSVKIKLKNTLALAQPFAIPLKITNSSFGDVSANQSSAIYLFQKVNNYDGIYMITGKFTDAQGVYTGRYPKYVELLTDDDNTVVMLDQNYGNFYYIITNLASGGAANMSGLGYRFDNATGSCTNVCSVSGGSIANPNYGTLVGTANKFAPQTLSYSPTPAFTVKFTASAGRYTIDDVFTYVSERNDAN